MTCREGGLDQLLIPGLTVFGTQWLKNLATICLRGDNFESLSRFKCAGMTGRQERQETFVWLVWWSNGLVDGLEQQR